MSNTKNRMPAYVGKYIREARIEKGMKQSELSRLTGISRSQLSQWESGNRNPSLESFNRVAPFLELTLDDILLKQLDCDIKTKNTTMNTGEDTAEKRESYKRIVKYHNEIMSILDSLSEDGTKAALTSLRSIQLNDRKK